MQYAVAWSGRVAGQEGIDYTFNDGQLDLAFFVVPKGADPDQKAAGQWHPLRDERAGEPGGRRRGRLLHRQQPRPRAAAAQDRLGEFPTTAANKDVQFLADAKWWFENAEEVETRWQEFKLGL